MPRPRLYHTPEEKKAANRAKSKRHYERNKADIHERRREKYTENNHRSTAFFQPIRNLDSAAVTLLNPKDDEREINFWRDRASQVKARLDKLTSNSTYNFVDLLVKGFILHGNDRPLQDALRIASRLLQRIQRYEDEVLALDGVGKHYQEVVGITRDVQLLVAWLEDILCNIMASELPNTFSNHMLMYQLQ